MIHEQLQQLISKSPLTETEQGELVILWQQLPAETQSHLAELIAEHEWLVPYLYINYAAKRYALAKGDPVKLKRVLENEAELLRDII